MDSRQLTLSAVLQAWIAIGLTLGLLDDPGRVWPWFSLGWAALAMLLITSFQADQYLWPYSAIVGWFAALPLAYAGYRALGLGYEALGWICAGAAALYAMAVIARCGLALLARR